MAASSDPAQSICDLPGEIVQQCEEGGILGTCDWGQCNGITVGWARSSADEYDDVLTICAECLKRGTDKGYKFPITESWTFRHVEDVLGWQEGALRGR